MRNRQHRLFHLPQPLLQLTPSLEPSRAHTHPQHSPVTTYSETGTSHVPPFIDNTFSSLGALSRPLPILPLNAAYQYDGTSSASHWEQGLAPHPSPFA